MSPEAEKARFLVRELCADSSSSKEMAALLKEGSRLFEVGSKGFRQRSKNGGVSYETFRLKLSFLHTAYGVRSSARSPRVRQSKLQAQTQAQAQAASPGLAKTGMALESEAKTSFTTKPAKSRTRLKSAIVAEGAKDKVHHGSAATPAHAPQLGRARQAVSQLPEISSGRSSLTVITRLAEELSRSAAMEASPNSVNGTKSKAANGKDPIPGDAPSNDTGTKNLYVPAAAA